MDKDKIIDIEVQYSSRWEKFKHNWSTKWNSFKNWVREKPQEAAVIGSVIVVTLDKLVRLIKKWKSIQPTQAELDRHWHETHIYDRSNGMYYEIKRPMTANEAMIFSHRKARGELTGDILMSMKLLK